MLISFKLSALGFQLNNIRKPLNSVENKRLNLSNSQLKWEIGFKRILIVMSVLLVLITKPIGAYMTRVFNGTRTVLSPVFGPIESRSSAAFLSSTAFPATIVHA